jgi:hypothetical protein
MPGKPYLARVSKGGAERYATKAERYATKAERYATAAGTLCHCCRNAMPLLPERYATATRPALGGPWVERYPDGGATLCHCLR